MLLKIGELAKRTGLTVRALHHYDKIGLLKPSARSDADYRLYNRDDIARLHRIQALRCLDLSLAEIAELLKGEGSNLQSIIEQQVRGLDRQIAQSIELRDRLRSLSLQLRDRQEPSLDQWLSTLEMMNMFVRYFTKDELEKMRQRKSMQQSDDVMRPIVLSMRKLMDDGVPAGSVEARELATRWKRNMRELMGEDPRLFLKLDRMHRNEASVQSMTGVDGAMIDYVTAALVESQYLIFAEYLSEEELRHFKPAMIANSQHWLTLFSTLRQYLEQGVPPEHPDAQTLAKQWMALANEAWGSKPATLDKLKRAFSERPELSTSNGLTPEMNAYIQKAGEHLYGMSLAMENQDA